MVRSSAAPALLALTLAGSLLSAGEPADGPSLIRDTLRTHLEADRPTQAIVAYNAWSLRRGLRVHEQADLGGLRALLRRKGYTPSEIVAAQLEPRDVAYLERVLFLHRVARTAVDSASSDREKARRLFRLVTRELAPHSSAESLAWPDGILIRGHGSADQMAWSLCALAEQLGISSLILFLRAPQRMKIHHAVAALRLDGAWRLFDPFQALAVGWVEEGPSLLAALRNPEKLEAVLPRAHGPVLLQPQHLLWSTFHVFTDPRGSLPRWSAFEQAAGLDDAGPHLWGNPLLRVAWFRQEAARVLEVPEDRLDRAVKGLSTAVVETEEGQPVSELAVEPFHRAFQIYRDRSGPRWQEKRKTVCRPVCYRKARIAHLTGRSEEALDLLAAGLDGSSGKGISTVEVDFAASSEANRLRYQALCFQALGRLEAAAQAYARLRATKSLWARTSAWNQALCLEALERAEAAREAWSAVSAPRQAAAAIRARKAAPSP